MNLSTTRILTTFFLVVVLGIISCTSTPNERTPPDGVMHYPHTMALFDHYLAVSSTDADGKYDSGRLVVLDTNAIKAAIDGGGSKEPIPWGHVVKSNLLIPPQVGDISYSDYSLVFSSLQSSVLLSLPITDGIVKCNSPFNQAALCPDARSLKLVDYDPWSLLRIAENANEDFIIASYLSSDRIDVIKLDKTAGTGLTYLKSFKTLDWISRKVDAKIIKNQRLVTRKLLLPSKGGSKVYFLIEQHPQKIQTDERPKHSYIVAVKVSDLMAETTISNLDLWDLSEIAQITGVRDFFVDESVNLAFVLGSLPEALYKLDLNQKAMIETSPVCVKASSMAVNSTWGLIFIPCFDDNKVVSYSTTTLNLKSSSRTGRGPGFCVTDERNRLVYCTLYVDGILVIFDEQLAIRGYVFDKAPTNRMGS
jgi:hypothetical protein